MNNEKRDVLTIIIAMLFGAAFACAILFPIHFTITRRADSAARELTDRLAESDRRLKRASDTITDCRTGIERIAKESETGGTTLSGVINSLKIIRDEVQVLEERFYSLDNDSGNNDRNDSVAVSVE